MPLIELTGVSKIFPRSGTGPALLRNHLFNLLRRPANPFYALRNVNFELHGGESVAIIGANGAGKSTLLGIIAGLAPPDEGTVQVNGRIAALLELGAGFHPDLTGAENVRLNAALIGLSKRRTEELFGEIVAFSEIGDFINEPLRTYSSGMMLRLAFAVAIHCDPEVLIIDEVLVVGDDAFQRKCFDKIFQFRRQGKALLCVSHSPTMVLTLCDRAVWLDHGEIVLTGKPQAVLDAYSGRKLGGVSVTGVVAPPSIGR